MRVYISGVKVIDGLLGARLCLLAVFVFVCSISSDTAANDIIEEPIRHRPSSLTDAQLKSAVTIEFDFKHIDKTNRTAVKIAYLETRRKILDRLNRRRRSTSSPTNPTTVAADTTIVATATTVATTAATTADVTTTAIPTATSTITTLASTTVTSTNPTTIVTTIITEPTTTTAAIETTQTTLAVESTTETPTTVSTTPSTRASDPPPERKRKRRSNGENNNTSTLSDDDLPFIDNDLELDENGILRISFFINSTEFTDGDLWEVLDELETEEDGFKEIAPVIDIYKGLPPAKGAMAMAGIPVWLPILLAIIILLIIFIIVFCCWKATHKKVRDVEHQKIVPKQDSKPSPSNSRSAHPRILDDNSGWLVPYEQFGSEQK